MQDITIYILARIEIFRLIVVLMDGLSRNQGDTIKLSAYSETKPLTYYSKSMKCCLDVKFYKYYLPVVYDEKHSSELQTFNIDTVNQDLFEKETRSNDNEPVE